MKPFFRCNSCLVAAVLLSIAATAQTAPQTATGLQPFGSFGGGPFDVINLGNLNVHFSIPIGEKAGRGTPFTQGDLVYESSVWAPVGTSGSQVWTPVTSTGNVGTYWGFQGLSNSGTTYIGYTATYYNNTQCGQSQTQYWYGWSYGPFIYYDRSGAHPFNAWANYYVNNCGNGNGPPNGASYPEGQSVVAVDGSGFTINFSVGAGTIAAYVTAKNGAVINAPLVTGSSQQGSYSYTDGNGNKITAVNGVYTDTLGQTALTVLGSAPSDTTLSYTAPGGTATYTVSYTPYTVKTNFGCSGVTEYNQPNVYLVNKIELPDGTSYTFGYEQTAGGTSGQVTARLTSVTLPTGGSITYSYPLTSSGKNAINCSDGSVAAASGSNPSLSRVVTPGGINPSGTWKYSRTQGSPSNLWTTTVTDPNSNQTSISFSKDTSLNPSNNFYETQRVVNQLISGTQTPLVTTIGCYNGVNVGTPSSCPTTSVASPITRRTTFNYLPTSSGKQSETDTTYDMQGMGLAQEVDSYDYGSAAVGAKLRKVLTSYGSYNSNGTCAALGNGILNLPCIVTVTDGSGNTLSKTTYSYDQSTPTPTTSTPQHISITGSRGNLTTVTTSTSSTASLSKTFTYYDTGNPYVATDVNGAQTTFAYGTGSCGNSFATTISEPLSLSRSIQWNCIGGVATKVTDESGNSVTSDYTTDPDFWRPDSVTDQMGNVTTLVYTAETAVETALQNFNGGNSVWDSRSTVDGFGRPIFSQRLQKPSGSYDTSETDYNNIGQPYRSTMPYTAAASPSTSNTTVAATTTTYDALGRVATITDADNGTVSYTYTKNDVLQKVSGSQTFQKQFEYDGLGRLTSVCEISSTLPVVGTCSQTTTQTGYWTKYAYDAVGRLLTVTQNAQAATNLQQGRTFAYDWLGRMTSETNPESGTTTYTYDSYSSGTCGGHTSEPGDLMLITKPGGIGSCYVYDALHRVSNTEGWVGASFYCQRFRYDAAANGIQAQPPNSGVYNLGGRLVEAETDNCQNYPNVTALTDEWISYGPRGVPSALYESTPHSGGYYQSVVAISANYQLQTLSLYNSSGGTLIPAQTFGLDSEGRVNSVSAASGQNPVTGVTYSTGTSTAPLGALTGVTFGSADSDAFTYDPNTGRMASYTFSVNGVNDKGTLTWNANGTLNSVVIADSLSGTSDSQTCNYFYDDLARLGGKNSNGYSVDCGTKWQQLFTFDSFGNISKSGTGSFSPTYSTANQFTSIPGVSGPYYDNSGSGNLIKDNLNTYTWDGFGYPASINSTNLIYDALGRMAEQQNGSTYTQMIYSPLGKTAIMSGQTLIKAFAPLPGGATAIYNPSGLAYYRHSDWLGSSRLTSTAGRAVYSSIAYAPFGEQYANSGTPDPSFTVQNSDTVASLYDFTFREHSPTQGRWISPDPAGVAAVDPTNPQTWNRYAYVMNNPLAFVDPLGLYLCGTHEDDPWCNGSSSNGGGGGGGGCTLDGVPVGCNSLGGLGSNGIAGILPGNCDPSFCIANGVIVPIQAIGDGQYGGCGQSGWYYFCFEFAPMPVDAANNWQLAVAGAQTSNSINQYVNTKTSDCYNAFHQTAIGKSAQAFSLVALFPIAKNYQQNLFNLGLEILGKLSISGGAGSQSPITALLGEFAGTVTTPALVAGTGADASMALACKGAAASTIGD